MRRPGPRVAVALAAALLGFMAVVAASSPPQATRAVRRTSLVDLIREEDQRVRELRGEVRRLEGQLAADVTGEALRSDEVRALEAQVQQLAVTAGGIGLEGPGVVITLDDSTAARSPSGDPNDLVVHEQDIQVVVNAVWAAGAEAVAINGERLTSTSAVRCAGNTLLLHGSVHSPPYEIAGIGDPEGLPAAIEAQPGMAALRDAAETFGLRLALEPVERVVIPAGPRVPRVREAAPA